MKTTTTAPEPARLARCRMTNRYGDPCTGEALDAEGEALICARHAGLVLELLQRHGVPGFTT